MAEVVTSNAASQLNLLALRQQEISADRNTTVEPAVAAPQNTPAVAKPASADASNLSDERSTRERPQPERRPPVEVDREPASGPSKARIELKQIDFGLTPSEVVGTIDVLQRFDDNGDGRVDMLESQQAQLSRSDGFTFSGLAAAPTNTEAPALTPDPTPQPVQAEATSSQAPENKIFVGPGQPESAGANAPVEKKFFKDEETASLGAPTGTEDAPRKFYGQGAEVVIGQFAAAAEAAPKYADKAPDARSEGAVSEEGTGETKYYDKVAQTETGQSFGDSPGENDRSYYDKAQEVASSARSDEENVGQKKFVHTELSAYSTTADISGDGQSVVIPGSTVITA